MKEIELLFKIDKATTDKIRKELKNFFINKSNEIDIYLYPPHRDFTVTKNGRENLRVRQSGEKKEFTYKKVVYNKSEYSHSIEKNVGVSDIENLVDILKSVGFRKYITIKKKREVFKEKNFIITIDDVKNLGLFTEIEWVGNEGNEAEIRKLCFERAEKFGLKTIQNKGYLRLLEEQGSVKQSS